MRSRRILRNQKNKRKTRILRKKTNFRKLANAKTRRRSKVGTKRRYTKKTRKRGAGPPILPAEPTHGNLAELSVLGPASGAAPESLPYDAIVFDVDDTLYPHICHRDISFDDKQRMLIKRIKEILSFLKTEKDIKLFVITRCIPKANILNKSFTEESKNSEISYTDLIPSKHIFGADWTDPHNRVLTGGEWSDLRVWNSTNYPFDTNYSVIKSEFLNQIRANLIKKKNPSESVRILFVDDDSANAKLAQSRGFDCITSPEPKRKGGGMIMTIRGLEDVFGKQPGFPEGLSKYPEISKQPDLVEGSFKFLEGSTSKLTFMKCVNNLAKYSNAEVESQVFNPKRTNKDGIALEVTFQSILDDIEDYVNNQLKFQRQGAMKKKTSSPETTTENEVLGNLFQTVVACLDDKKGIESVSITLGEALKKSSNSGDRTKMLETIRDSFKGKPKTKSCRTTEQQRDIVKDAICEFKYNELYPITYSKEIDKYMLKDKQKGSWFLRNSSIPGQFTIVIKTNDETDEFEVVKYKIIKNDKQKYLIQYKGGENDSFSFDDFKSLLTHYSKNQFGKSGSILDPNKLLMEEDPEAPPLPPKGGPI